MSEIPSTTKLPPCGDRQPGAGFCCTRRRGHFGSVHWAEIGSVKVATWAFPAGDALTERVAALLYNWTRAPGTDYWRDGNVSPEQRADILARAGAIIAELSPLVSIPPNFGVVYERRVTGVHRGSADTMVYVYTGDDETSGRNARRAVTTMDWDTPATVEVRVIITTPWESAS